MKISHAIQALLLLFALGLTWGSGYSIAHYATTNGVSPLGYAFWQSFGPAVCLSLLARALKIPLIFSKQYLKYYFICGLIGIAIPNTNMYFAAQHVTPGILAVVVNTVPIMTYIIALAMRTEDVRLTRTVGTCAVIVGLMLFVTPKVSLPDSHMIPWLLSALITPMCFALCAIYSAKQPTNSHALSLAAGMLIASTILLTPIVIANHDFYIMRVPLHLRDYIIILEIILSSLGYVMLFRLLKIAGALFYSLVGGIVSITGLLWGHIIFHESFTSVAKWAIGLIIFGVLIASIQIKDDYAQKD